MQLKILESKHAISIMHPMNIVYFILITLQLLQRNGPLTRLLDYARHARQHPLSHPPPFQCLC